MTVQRRHGKSGAGGPWRVIRSNAVRHLQGEPEAEGDEEGLAPRERRRAPGNSLAFSLTVPKVRTSVALAGPRAPRRPPRCKKSAKIGPCRIGIAYSVSRRWGSPLVIWLLAPRFCAWRLRRRPQGVAGRVTATYSTPGTAPLRDGCRRSGSVRQFAAPDRIRAVALGRSDVREDRSLVAGDRAVAPADRLRSPAIRRRPGYAWTGLDATLEDADGCAGHADPGRHRHSPVGVSRKRPTAGQRGVAQGRRARGLRPRARHALRRRRTACPAEHVFQVWNEPNLSLDLGPASASASTARWSTPSPTASTRSTRRISSSRAPSTRSATRRARSRSGTRSPRSPSCARCSASRRVHIRTATCSDAVHFDVWSHHPYTLRRRVRQGERTRRRRARRSAEDAVRCCRRACGSITSSRRIPVKFWVTEFGWDTQPAAAAGAAPIGLASRWTAESLYQMWRSGVSLVTWFDLAGPVGHRARTRAASTSMRRRSRQRAAEAGAHRLPVPVRRLPARLDRERLGPRRDERQGSASAIQLRHGKSGSWRTVAYVVANSNGIFQAALKLRADEDRTGCALSRRAPASRSPSPSRCRTTRTSAPWGGLPPPRR